MAGGPVEGLGALSAEVAGADEQAFRHGVERREHVAPVLTGMTLGLVGGGALAGGAQAVALVARLGEFGHHLGGAVRQDHRIGIPLQGRMVHQIGKHHHRVVADPGFVRFQHGGAVLLEALEIDHGALAFQHRGQQAGAGIPGQAADHSGFVEERPGAQGEYDGENNRGDQSHPSQPPPVRLLPRQFPSAFLLGGEYTGKDRK